MCRHVVLRNPNCNFGRDSTALKRLSAEHRRITAQQSMSVVHWQVWFQSSFVATSCCTRQVQARYSHSTSICNESVGDRSGVIGMSVARRFGRGLFQSFGHCVYCILRLEYKPFLSRAVADAYCPGGKRKTLGWGVGSGEEELRTDKRYSNGL